MTRPAPPIPPKNSPNKVAKLPRRGPTEEGRQRLSEVAKERWASGGFKKKPGANKGGRPRKRGPSKARIATQVAEAARDYRTANQIIDVFKDAIRPTQPMHIRLKAVEAWLRIEHEDAKLQIQESESASQERDRAELLELLSEKLTSGHSAFLLRKQLEQQSGVIDATVVDGQSLHREGAAE